MTYTIVTMHKFIVSHLHGFDGYKEAVIAISFCNDFYGNLLAFVNFFLQPFGNHTMACVSTINLKNLCLKTNIGFYGPNDVIPKEHLLDMCLVIDTNLVLIENDGMEFVFDYDPIMKTIEHLAGDGHYHTQERLLTRIIHACADYVEIQGVTLNLRKTPVLKDGLLGVEITVDNEYLNRIRSVT